MTALLIGAARTIGGVAARARADGRRSIPLGALLAPVLVLGMAGSGRAQVKMVTNVPDFYQHQFWVGLPGGGGGPAGWEATGGWCLPTAITDALYPWKVQANYGGLFDNKITTAAQWLPASGVAINDVRPFGADINGYLESKMLGSTANAAGNPSLKAMTFQVDATTGNVSVNLAAGRTEVVNKAGTNYTAMSLYSALQDQGRTSVLILNKTPASFGNNLWWANDSYHAVAGAGYDAAKQQILVADPDSNKGNLAANAGWWNVIANPSPPPPKITDLSAASKAAAIALVQANMYTAADGAAAPPLPGNLNGAGGGKTYTNSDLYGTMTLDNKGLVTAGDNANYVNTRIADMLMISPTLAADTGFKLNAGKFESTFAFMGDVNSKVDQIELFPTVSLADSEFAGPQGGGWGTSEVTVDPYGYARPGGGLELTANSLGNDLSSGGLLGGVTLDTFSQFSSFDVYYHDSLTGDWVVQSEGADPLDLPLDQQFQAVPAPPSCVMLALGLGIAGIVAGIRGRGRAARALVSCHAGG